MTVNFATRERTARKVHRCADCGAGINPGSRYVDCTVFPRHDVLGTDRPYRFANCWNCVLRYERRRLGISEPRIGRGET